MAEKVRVGAFGLLLKDLRERLGWSVEQVAHYLAYQHKPAIATNQGTLSGYEQGWREKPDPVILWGLSAAYQRPLDGLLAVLHENRRNRGMSLDEGLALLVTYGPSPRVAVEALRATSAKLLELAEDVEALSVAAESRVETPTTRRRPPHSPGGH